MTDIDIIRKVRDIFLILLIVIGLTGRTGSGCSTFADLMSNDNFEDCEFPEPNNTPDADNNERKYRIAYNFLSENWGSFFVINYCKILSLIAYKEQLQEIEGLIETTLIEFNGKFNISNNLEKETQALEKLRDETSFIGVPEDEVDLYNFFISEDFSNFHNAFQDALKIENDLNRILILHNFCNNLRKVVAIIVI